MSGAKMGLVDLISRHPIHKPKKVSAYDEEFSVAQLKLTSASVNSLELQSSHSALHLHTLLQVNDLESQIKPRSEPITNEINLISPLATRARRHDYYFFHVPQNQFTNTSCNSNNLKSAYPASQIPINTPLAEQNSTQFKPCFQNQNEKRFARHDLHFSKLSFSPIKKHSENISESRYPKKSVLFASNHSRINSYKLHSTFSYFVKKI